MAPLPTDDWPMVPAPGDATSRDYLRAVLEQRGDVDSADTWALASRMSASRDEGDVHRDLGLRLASGWSLDDVEYSLRVLG